MSLQWKVVELSSVTDEEIERTLNEWSSKGWTLETIQFAMRESSKRPAMAFIAFTQERPEEDEHPPHLRPVDGGSRVGILEGKVGVVTGAASGIGRAIAQHAAAEGARVIAADILDESGEKTVRWIREHGGEATYVHCDVTSEAEVEGMVATAVSAYGGLDWAANNAAGGEVTKHLHQLDDAEWSAFVDVGLRGVFLCMKHELPALLERGGGSIVNTGSMVGVNGMPLMAAYSAAKGGVIALTKSAAAEYAPMKVRVNVVNPGMVLTPGNEKFLASGSAIADAALSAHALGRAGLPAEIAHVICFLASDRASFITGEAIAVDGGSNVKATTYPLDLGDPG